ncbi:MAG: hypothetical protein IJU37_11880 [Desulfovibrio sp.]|nr:hypothetical protein [Desulfovibrio sp.]
MANREEDALAEAMRKCSGGVGEPLSEAQITAIREGPKNSPENNNPFDETRFLEGAEVFFKNHPIDAVQC